MTYGGCDLSQERKKTKLSSEGVSAWPVPMASCQRRCHLTLSRRGHRTILCSYAGRLVTSWRSGSRTHHGPTARYRYTLQGRRAPGVLCVAQHRLQYGRCVENPRRRLAQVTKTSAEQCRIIDPDRAFEIIGEAKPYNIYLFDDIGVGWNSRSFASKDNRDKNDIFQINRVAQTVQILSMPNQFLLDKVPRMLCNYMAEMDRSEYSRGFSLMKVFKTKTLFRLNNQRITPHLVAEDGAKITKYVVHRPPAFLAKQYDKIREDVTRRIISEQARQEEGGSRISRKEARCIQRQRR